METLLKCDEICITESEIINLKSGERISTYDIIGERAVSFPPAIKDYIGYGAVAILGFWSLSNGWVIIGLIALVIGGIGIYVSTKRKTRFDLVVWHVGDTTTHFDFNSYSSMDQASKALSQLIIRNKKNENNE